jgi:hypothetical protein
MSKFIYIGGTRKTEHFSERMDDKGNPYGYDERQGAEMPDSTTAFGIKFIINQPVDVSRDKFESDDAHRHALMKLEKNRYFKAVAGDAEFTMVEPEKPRGKPGPKPRQLPEPVVQTSDE